MKGKWTIGRWLLLLGMLVVSGRAGAQPQYQLQAATESDLIFRGNLPNEFAAQSIAPAGDVNNDRLGDLIIGAPGANRVYILLGRSFADGIIDPPAAGRVGNTTDFRKAEVRPGLIIINNDLLGAQFGWSVSTAGDFNGDRIGDVIIGWPGSAPNNEEMGAAVVVLGRDDWIPTDRPVTIPLSDLFADQTAILLQGVGFADRAGACVAGGGDYNGDGLGDVIVAAPGATNVGGQFEGKYYVVLGSTDHPPTLTLEQSLFPGFEVMTPTLGGMALNTSSTVCAWAGDANGDTFDDVLLGTPEYTIPGYQASGAAWLILGQLDPPQVPVGLDSINNSATVIRFTADPPLAGGAHAGFAVAGLGDLNGDQHDEFAIGVPDDQWLGTGGMVAIVPGKPDYPFSTELYVDQEVTRIIDDLGRDGERFGASIAPAGDPNNDGVRDLVVGAPGSPSQIGRLPIWRAGRAFVIYVEPVPGDRYLSDPKPGVVEIGGVFGDAGFRLDLVGDLFGWSVAGPGDLNGDGVDDVLVGAPRVRPGVVGVPPSGMAFGFFFRPPRIQAVFHDDFDSNGDVDPGEFLNLILDRPVRIVPGPIEDLFYLAGPGQLGSGSIMGQKHPDSKTVIVSADDQTTDLVIPGDQSALDVNVLGMKGRILSLRLGVNPLDAAGRPGVNDAGIDIQRRFGLVSQTVDAAGGGIVTIAAGGDFFFGGHSIAFPPGALSTDAGVEFGPILTRLGDRGYNSAFQLTVNQPFDEAILTVQYREEDIPPAMHEGQMRVVQILEPASGAPRLLILPGPQIVDTVNNRVSASLSSARFESAVQRAAGGGTGKFAGIPIETVDENRSKMEGPSMESTPVAPTSVGLAPAPGKMATVSLPPGPYSLYTKHQIVFHDYVTSTPGNLQATIRTATTPERTYTHPVVDSRYFPDLSDACFTVETEDAEGNPISLISPVDIAIEFKASGNPQGQSDIIDFDQNPGSWKKMRICRSVLNQITNVPDFVFVGETQSVDYGNSVVTIEGYTGLTGSEGKATYGVVVDVSVTRAAHWSLYR